MQFPRLQLLKLHTNHLGRETFDIKGSPEISAADYVYIDDVK